MAIVHSKRLSYRACIHTCFYVCCFFFLIYFFIQNNTNLNGFFNDFSFYLQPKYCWNITVVLQLREINRVLWILLTILQYIHLFFSDRDENFLTIKYHFMFERGKTLQSVWNPHNISKFLFISSIITHSFIIFTVTHNRI